MTQPAPYYTGNGVTLHLGDSLDILPTLPDNSVDAVVCDPPYGLAELPAAVVQQAISAWLAGDRTHVPTGKGGFMGKDWDRFVPPPGLWDECFRVLKPGGHLAAFAGSRTVDLMGLAIRMAGFEIRDSIHWITGTGFPKSLDVSKAIDKETGENQDRQLRFTAWMRSTGITAEQINAATGTRMASHYLTDKSQPAIATADLFDKLRPYLPEVPEEIERLVAERTGIEWTAYKHRKVIGQGRSGAATVAFVRAAAGDYALTTPATDDAKRWSGWGTALKPSHEPVVLARKSLEGTVAANVLAHGTGALNIDATRVRPSSPQSVECASAGPQPDRWPTNIVLSHLPLVGGDGSPVGDACADGCGQGCPVAELDSQSPGASRYFPIFRYQAKASSKERPRLADGTVHPTVKPVGLMSWLVRLITPPGGTVLEPFAGSGTTLEACVLEGFEVIGIERHEPYAELCRVRLSKPIETTLFGDVA